MDKSSSFWLATLALPLIIQPVNAATYYISPTGNNNNPGTSTSQAWQSIDRINRTTFQAGDRIAFQGGATFNGTLQFDASDRGTASQPIVIGSYGTGRATINGGTNSGIFVYNSAGYRIENLRLQGAASNNPNASGIVFYSDLANGVKLDYIRINNVEAYGFESAGISIGSWHPSKSGFRDVRIEWATVHDNRHVGIIIYGYEDPRSTSYSHQSVYIGRSVAYNNLGIPYKGAASGSGILVGDTADATIEYNEAYNNGQLNNYAAAGPVGIWAWDATRVKIQYNQSHHNHSQTYDGNGFDLDTGMSDSIMQYNFSYNNDGAGYMIAQVPNSRPSRNNTIRYNVSQNDGRSARGHGGIQLWNRGSGIERSQIYHNTIVFKSPTPSTSRTIYIDGDNIQAGIYNNIFISNGSSPIVAVTPPQGTLKFQGNFYWSGNNNLRFNWGSQTYQSLRQWQSGASQELLSGRVVGRTVDPKLNYNDLPVLYVDSSAINAGLNLNQLYGIQVGSQDAKGQSIPKRGAYDVGAYEMP
jgi:hypothetical protein